MKKILLYTMAIVAGLLSFIIIKEYLQMSFHPLITNHQKNKIIDSLNDYKTINTENFTIYFKEGEESISKITGDIIEKHYDYICSYLEYYPKEKTPIIIYENEEDIIETIGLNRDSSAPLGVYYSGTVNILSPKMWLAKDNLIEEYKKNSPVVHEFTHLIVDKKTKGNYPLWLTEGLALFMEESTMGIEWNAGIGETSNITLRELNDNFDTIDAEISYRKSYETIVYLESQYEFDNINLLLDNLGIGTDIDHSLKRVFKRNLNGF